MAVHGNAFDENSEIYAETVEIIKHNQKHSVYGYPIEERSLVQWPKRLCRMEFE